MRDIELPKKENYRFEHFFELSADLCCIAGFDGYFKRINASVSKVLGFTNEELFSKPINEFVHPDDQEVTEKVRNELRNNKPLLNFENRYLTKNGEVVWLSWTSMPIYEEKIIFAIAKNVTHKKTQEAERNDLLAALTKTNTDFKQFAYITSHNLKSPLNNFLSIVNLIDVSNITDKTTLDLLKLLKTETLNLKQTWKEYEDVLIEKRNLNVSTENLDLEQSLQGVLRSINSLIQSSNANLYINFSKLKTIHFNRVYLESIFLNLITNSIKYSRPDCFPEISISSKCKGHSKQLIISDNGLGFDMEKVKNKIFGLHQKFHHHEDSKGIGLYLVYNHITSLGGQIEVESKLNEGSTFTITFRD